MEVTDWIPVLADAYKRWPITMSFVARHADKFEEQRSLRARGDACLDYFGGKPMSVIERCWTAKQTLAHLSGATEPWIAQAVCALLRASGGSTVLETGGFLGHTSIALAETLVEMGGGNLTICELDSTRAQATDTVLQERFPENKWPSFQWRVVAEDVLKYIPTLLDASLDLVWIDDDHTKEHVSKEVEALWPKMAPHGLLTFHDVHGSCDLQEVVRHYGGYTLDLPRLEAAGGLGIIQVG